MYPFPKLKFEYTGEEATAVSEVSAALQNKNGGSVEVTSETFRRKLSEHVQQYDRCRVVLIGMAPSLRVMLIPTSLCGESSCDIGLEGACACVCLCGIVRDLKDE